MVMDYLKKKVAHDQVSDQAEKPHWVSDNNASCKAWQYVELMKHEKTKYINSHNKRTHFMNKSSYQISAAETARAIKINRSTLMHHSSYSEIFTIYLDEVNAQLERAMKARLEASNRRPSRGPISSSKDELVSLNAELRAQIAHLEIQKTEELVTLAFDRLPLPARRILGLD